MNRAMQWKLIAGFLLVFVAGAITGAFVGGSYARHHFFKLHRPERIGAQMKDRLSAELNLTPEQVAKVSPLIATPASASIRSSPRHTGRWLPHSQMSSAKNFSKAKSGIDSGVIIIFANLQPKCRQRLRSCSVRCPQRSSLAELSPKSAETADATASPRQKRKPFWKKIRSRSTSAPRRRKRSRISGV